MVPPFPDTFSPTNPDSKKDAWTDSSHLGLLYLRGPSSRFSAHGLITEMSGKPSKALLLQLNCVSAGKGVTGLSCPPASCCISATACSKSSA